MSQSGEMQHLKQNFNRARCRLAFAMGPAISTSASVTQSSVFVDAINDVFEALDAIHILHEQKLGKLENQLRERALLEALEKSQDEDVKKDEAGKDGTNVLQKDVTPALGVAKECDTAHVEQEHRASPQRFLNSNLEMPKVLKPETSSDSLATGEVQGQDDEDIAAPLKRTGAQPRPTSCGNRSGDKNDDVSSPRSNKKREAEDNHDKELKKDDGVKKQKKTPCKRCCLFKKTSLTDSKGFFDEIAFGMWLKEGKCVETLHYPREVTVPLKSSRDFHKETFDETPTLPPEDHPDLTGHHLE